MGVPYHTSRDIPGRCLWLIERLLPEARMVRAPDEPELGPLDTTFLFAMSTLIITLPIERLERHRRREERGEQGYMDDRPLDPSAAREIDAVLGNDDTTFRDAPFYVPHAWRFASINYEPHHNLALRLPEKLKVMLSEDDASRAADEMSARAWVNCIRNALAHGGILYLDADGRQSRGRPTEMMGLASALYPRGNLRVPPEKIIALRTSREGYRATLQKWVSWVQSTGLADALAA
jgi:hypothetical protein